MPTPTFKLNIFGATNRNQIDNSLTQSYTYFLFNLHILQVEYSDIVLTDFDMFIEYFAYPFLPTFAGTVFSSVGTQIVPNNTLGNRRGEVPRPQIIHLTATTPTSPIDLYNCGFAPLTQLPPNGLNPCTQPIVSSPCPNPEDFRLFSMSHYVRVVFQTNNKCFDPGWTNMKSNFPLFTGSNVYIVDGIGPYKLPIKIIILANGCRYEKVAEVNIYDNWFNDVDLFGSANCQYNPLGRPLGYDDKIIIS